MSGGGLRPHAITPSGLAQELRGVEQEGGEERDVFEREIVFSGGHDSHHHWLGYGLGVNTRRTAKAIVHVRRF